MQNLISFEADIQINKKLGKGSALGNPKNLMLKNLLTKKGEAFKPPVTINKFKKRKSALIRDYGNNEHGCCTIAKQALASIIMERDEQRRTIDIPTKNILDTYYRLTDEKYGGGDTGAYEIDALNNYRNPEKTFKDSKGRPYTIDAFLKVDHTSVVEFKTALCLAEAMGLAVCFQLPLSWSGNTYYVWDTPKNANFTGDNRPGSWGGHSCWSIAQYNIAFFTLPSTWNEQAYQVAFSALHYYVDEVFIVIDSIDSWRKKKTSDAKGTEISVGKLIDLSLVRSEVNKVSDIQIA